MLMAANFVAGGERGDQFGIPILVGLARAAARPYILATQAHKPGGERQGD